MDILVTNRQRSAAPSAGYRELLAQTLQARRQDNEACAVAALIADPEFAPTDPDRDETARQVVRVVLDALARISP